MRILVAIGGLLAVTSSAWAADLPVAPPPPMAPAVYVPAPAVYNWTGFYIGGNGGYGFANGDASASITGGALGGATATASGHFNGGVAGGQIGANYQISAWVFGIEGDVDWSGQQRNDSFVCGVGCSVTETNKISWFSTIRLRSGYAFDRVLVYGTGGVAWLHVSDTVSSIAGGVSTTWISPSDTATGWTLGGGVEVALAQNWTVRGEYLYMQAKPTLTTGIPAAIGGGTFSENATLKDSVIRAGFNFKYP